jgi:carboxymethylenebutenolidase
MRHSPDRRPPAVPVAGGVASQSALTLTAGDGAQVLAYQADPVTPNGRNVIILPDERGLHPYYRALAERFAQAGFGALAIDYFARTAGPDDRGRDFDYLPHVQKVRPSQVQLDVQAAIAHLRTHARGEIFTVGFGFGGSHSWRLAASSLGLSGVVGFCGRPSLLADVSDDLHLPMLLLIAGADAATPLEEFDAFAERLDEAGTHYVKHVFDGAPDSFFDRHFAEWPDYCDQAWQDILDFTAHPATLS